MSRVETLLHNRLILREQSFDRGRRTLSTERRQRTLAYGQFLAAHNDPKHKRHADFGDWMEPGTFDPNDADLEALGRQVGLGRPGPIVLVTRSTEDPISG